MSTMTDRYVAVAARGVPEGQRPDVEMELRAAIADAVDARTAAGESTAAAERAVLIGMGDPARLAVAWSDRPRYLIGPRFFLEYQRLLILLLAIVVPIVTAIAGVASFAEGDGFGPVIGDMVVAAMMTGVQIAFWTTLCFAVLDRTDLERGRLLSPWSPDALPDVESRLPRGQMVSTLAMVALVAVGVLWQQVAPLVPGPDGVRVPVLDRDLWTFWLPALLVLLAAGAVVEVMRYRAGGWTVPLAAVNTLLSVAFAVPFAVLAWRGDLLDPAFLRAVEWPDGGEAGGPLGLGIAVGIVALTAWGVADSWRLALRSLHGRSGERLVPAL